MQIHDEVVGDGGGDVRAVGGVGFKSRDDQVKSGI